MEKLLQEGTVQGIKYHNTKRNIVPVAVPSTNIKAIDVSSLSLTKQEKMAGLVKEYLEYLELVNKTAFNFEEWVEQTKGEKISPSWRTFKLSETKIL